MFSCEFLRKHFVQNTDQLWPTASVSWKCKTYGKKTKNKNGIIAKLCLQWKSRKWICSEFPFLVSAIFIKFVFFHQMIALQKLWKMLFISSKKLFSFSRYSIFVFLSFPLFLPVGHYFRGWSKINFKVHDVINCPSKRSITFCLISWEGKELWHWNLVHRWSIR